MHINFEDENIIVQNIQIFLKEHYDKQIIASGVYDIDTHKALIRYLKKPNTQSMQYVKSQIIKEFTYRNAEKPHDFVENGGIYNFDNKVTTDEILFYTKPLSKCFDAGIEFINTHIDELSDFVENMGWSIVEYTQYTHDAANETTKAIIRIQKTGIENVFPNRTVLPMINLFEGTYIYNRCFLDEKNKYHGYIQTSPNYKIAVIPCEPGDTFTISHGYGVACEMAFAYTDATLRELRSDAMIPIDIDNAVSRMTTSPQGSIIPGRWDYFTIPKDASATYLLVQMPYRSDMVSSQTRTTKIKRGDINGDGIIDMNDVTMLNDWVTAKEQNHNPPFEMTESMLLAANVTMDLDLDGNPVISRDDVTVLQTAVQSGNPDFGEAEFEQQIRVSEFELDRLLIMYGDDAKDESLNIPIATFYEHTWAVHSKFIEYFLGRVIHKYSKLKDIQWLRAQLKQYYGNINESVSFYDEINDYISDDSFIFDELTQQWKYYRNGIYMDLILRTSDGTLRNGQICKDNGIHTNSEIINSCMYINGKPDGRIVLDDGRIVNIGHENSLRSRVKELQTSFNNMLNHDGISIGEQITWANGYFDTMTERMLALSIDGNINYSYGAFR